LKEGAVLLVVHAVEIGDESVGRKPIDAGPLAIDRRKRSCGEKQHRSEQDCLYESHLFVLSRFCGSD